MRAGKAWIMVKQSRPEDAMPKALVFETQSLTIFLEEIEAHFERARAAEVTIVGELLVPQKCRNAISASNGLNQCGSLQDVHPPEISGEEPLVRTLGIYFTAADTNPFGTKHGRLADCLIQVARRNRIAGLSPRRWIRLRL